MPSMRPSGLYEIPSTACATARPSLSSDSSVTTHISLVVSVPVLSEQITVVQPSVSTDGSFRTMQLRRAIDRVPSDRHLRVSLAACPHSVITAGRPSGMAATPSATATFR